MKTTNTLVHNDGDCTATVELGPTEDLHTTVADAFYKIGPFVVTGHDINGMQRVCWDSEQQQWRMV